MTACKRLTAPVSDGRLFAKISSDIALISDKQTKDDTAISVSNVSAEFIVAVPYQLIYYYCDINVDGVTKKLLYLKVFYNKFRSVDWSYIG